MCSILRPSVICVLCTHTRTGTCVLRTRVYTCMFCVHIQYTYSGYAQDYTHTYVNNICTRGAGINDHDCVKRERTQGERGGGGDEVEEEEEEMERNGKGEKEEEECGREDGGEGREGGSGR